MLTIESEKYFIENGKRTKIMHNSQFTIKQHMMKLIMKYRSTNAYVTLCVNQSYTTGLIMNYETSFGVANYAL